MAWPGRRCTGAWPTSTGSHRRDEPAVAPDGRPHRGHGRAPATTARGRQVAAYDTRAPKDVTIDPDALRPAWAERLADFGFDREAIQRCYGRQRGPALVSDADRAGLFALMASQDGITEFASTFDRRDVV